MNAAPEKNIHNHVLERGAQNTDARKPSAWYLAKKAVVLLYPDSGRGCVVWALGSAS
jgi:hypothetical protein